MAIPSTKLANPHFTWYSPDIIERRLLHYALFSEAHGMTIFPSSLLHWEHYLDCLKSVHGVCKSMPIFSLNFDGTNGELRSKYSDTCTYVLV